LSSGLLSKTVKVKIYETIILSLVLYRRETWSLALDLREEHRLKLRFEVSTVMQIQIMALYPEDGGDNFLRNVDKHLQDYTTS
jgi:hypothetical protein